jgi:hypothetical protein
LLGAALALYTWFRERRPGGLALLGLHCGFAAASKYTGWMFAASLLVPALLLVWRKPGAIRGTALLLGPVLLLLLPWLVKNTLYTGNPIFPNLHALWGTEAWSEVQELHYRLAMRTVQHAGPEWTWVDFVKMPFHLTWSDQFYSCPSFSIALMLLFLVAPFLPLAPGGRLFAAVAWLGFVAWGVSVPQGRYLVAWVPVMTLPAAFALGTSMHRRSVCVLVTVVVLAAGAYQLFTQSARFAPRWPLLLQSRHELVRRNPGYALNEHLNRIVPPDGRVLGLWENRFFFLERDFEADAVWQVPSILGRLREVDDAARFAELLVAEGITHVVLRPAGMESYFANDYAYDMTDALVYPPERYARDRELMLQLIRDHLVPLGRFDEYLIYRLGMGFAKLHGGPCNADRDAQARERQAHAQTVPRASATRAGATSSNALRADFQSPANLPENEGDVDCGATTVMGASGWTFSRKSVGPKTATVGMRSAPPTCIELESVVRSARDSPMSAMNMRKSVPPCRSKTRALSGSAERTASHGARSVRSPSKTTSTPECSRQKCATDSGIPGYCLTVTVSPVLAPPPGNTAR